jgi:flagellin
VNKEMEISMERLSTGKRINGASDDAAGVAIASRLTAEIKGTNQAIRNAMDGQALIDTAEGAHQEIENILQRMRELAVQAANDTNDADDRTNLNTEFSNMQTEIDRIAAVTTWAGQSLLNGTGSGSGNAEFDLQVGAGNSTTDVITATISSMTATALGNGTSTSGSVTTAGVDGVTAVTGVAQVVNVALAVANSAATSDTTTINIGSQAIQYTAAGNSETLATIITGLTAAASSASYSGASFSAGSDGVSIDVTYAATGAQTDTITAVTTGTAATTTGTVSTAGVDAVTAVTAVAQIQQVDASGYTITADKTYTLNVGDVQLSHTAVTGDTISSVVAGFLADSDYDATAFTVTESSGTISITQATAAAVASPDTVTFDDGLFDISSKTAALASIALMDTAISTVNTQRATLGSVSNRLDSTVSNLTNISSNLQAGRGRIEDADFAAETTSLAKSQILQQASTAMLAQANASKQNVLSLLQG